MSIQENFLHSIGATKEYYRAGEYIFRENATPKFYYQIVTGDVKLNNYDNDGKEFIQSILTSEDALGTSMLFLEKSYPINAIALVKCTILKICRNDFLKLLDLNPHLYQNICKSLSENLYSKSLLMRKISCRKASERLQEVLQMMKKGQENQLPYTFEIPLTRQQLASLTGLCVETTIRTIKKMERDNLLRIIDRKILY